MWTDIDFMHGTVKVTRKEAKNHGWKFDPKGKRTREVPLPDFLLELFQEAKKVSKSRLIFPSKPHWKAPNARPGGRPSDEFLETARLLLTAPG